MSPPSAIFQLPESARSQLKIPETMGFAPTHPVKIPCCCIILSRPQLQAVPEESLTYLMFHPFVLQFGERVFGHFSCFKNIRPRLGIGASLISNARSSPDRYD